MNLNKDSKLPLEWAAVVLSTMVGLAFWIGTVYWETKTIHAQVEEFKIKQDKYAEAVQELDKKIERILVKLERK